MVRSPPRPGRQMAYPPPRIVRAHAADVDEEFTAPLCALADSDLEADDFLLPFGCRTDQHQHAFGIVFHPGLQVDPVSPNIHVLPCREIPLLPGVIIRLPLRRHPRDYGRRQVWRVLAQEGGEPLLEITGRHPAQVENWQQRVEALGPPRPFRQDRRGEADFLPRTHVAAVAHLGAPNLDRPNPGLDCALRSMTVTHDAVAAVR